MFSILFNVVDEINTNLPTKSGVSLQYFLKKFPPFSSFPYYSIQTLRMIIEYCSKYCFFPPLILKERKTNNFFLSSLKRVSSDKPGVPRFGPVQVSRKSHGLQLLKGYKEASSSPKTYPPYLPNDQVHGSHSQLKRLLLMPTH